MVNSRINLDRNQYGEQIINRKTRLLEMCPYARAQPSQTITENSTAVRLMTAEKLVWLALITIKFYQLLWKDSVDLRKVEYLVFSVTLKKGFSVLEHLWLFFWSPDPCDSDGRILSIFPTPETGFLMFEQHTYVCFDFCHHVLRKNLEGQR